MANNARFSDNLYASIPSLAHKGCGLIGFCDSFYYKRHAENCEPGKWLVGVVGGEAGEFYELLMNDAQAVVDDFGNLRRVDSQ